MHQDIEDSLAASSISHAGGPQSPARSAENLLNGHRSKGLTELGRRGEEAMVTDSPGQPAQVPPHTHTHTSFFHCLYILYPAASFLTFKRFLQGACAAASGPTPMSGSGPSRAPAPSTSGGAKQRPFLFRWESAVLLFMFMTSRYHRTREPIVCSHPFSGSWRMRRRKSGTRPPSRPRWS